MKHKQIGNCLMNSTAVVKHHDQKYLWGKGFQLKAGVQTVQEHTDAIKKTAFYRLSQFVFLLYTPGLAEQDQHYSQWSWIFLITKNEIAPQACAQANQMGAFFSIEVPSSKVSIKLTRIMIFWAGYSRKKTRKKCLILDTKTDLLLH